MTKKRRRIGRIKRWLELRFPTRYPITLRIAALPAAYKDCLGVYQPPTQTGRRAMIRIGDRAALSTQIDTLMHEWAHARIDWNADATERSHGGHTNEFYLEYGRIERAFLSALEKELKR